MEQYPEAFDGLQDSPLKGLLSSVEVFNFDKEDYKDRDLNGHVGLGEAVETSSFLDVFAQHNLNNIVQSSNDDIVYELFIASIIQKKPRLFINNPVTILNSQSSSVQPMRLWQENFNATEHKERVLDSINEFLSENKSLARLSENVAIIVDELFSNALFNAPIDDNGYPIYKNMARNEKIRYPGNKNSKIFAVHTNKDLFIGCVDPWGSIDRDHIVNVMHRAYSEGKVNDESLGNGKGAGFGMRMMLDRSRSVYILSEHRKRSLVCAHMRLNISLKKIEYVPKQVHINCFG